jgi:small subunit ribosomal protein S7
MARRKSVNFIRNVGLDARWNSEDVQKLINVIMWRGEKNIARGIVYGALEILVKKTGGDRDKALKILLRALEQVTPLIEVKPRRVGGSVYQIPSEVPRHRGRSLALRWLVSNAALRSDKTMKIRLANEIMDSSEGRGNTFKKKLDVHKMAEANRAFSHYSW